MTERQQRNLATAHRYVELYNHDIERFVPECYTPDCQVHVMGRAVIEGAQSLLEVERTVLRAAPRRQMRLAHVHVMADTVIVEVTLLNPDAGADWALPFAAVLTMRDGRIAIDRSYAEWARWPGL